MTESPLRLRRCPPFHKGGCCCAPLGSLVKGRWHGETVTEGFRRAIRTVETGDPSAAADIALLRVRIQGLADGERITLGNIF